MTDYVSAMLGNGYSSFSGYSGYSSYSNRYTGSYDYQSATASNTITRNFAQSHRGSLDAINSAFQNGNVKRAMSIYDDLVDELSNKTSEYSDIEIANMIDEAYRSVTGNSMSSAIAQNTYSAYGTGLREGIPFFGLGTNGVSEAEATAQITGKKASVGDKIIESLGAATPGLATAAIGTGVAIAAATAPAWIPVAAGCAIVGGLFFAATGVLKSIIK